MPLEIEIKVKLESHELVRERLRAVGAKCLGMVRETNVFFDRGDGELLKGDCGLRVRFMDRDGEERRALLTYKGRRLEDALRSREAFDVTVGPWDQVVPMLLALGFAQILLFEKERESWELEGCLVELDRLPVLGRFLEVEGPDEKKVMGVFGRLGLGGMKAEEKGYSRMVTEYLRGRGEGAMELRF